MKSLFQLRPGRLRAEPKQRPAATDAQAVHDPADHERFQRSAGHNEQPRARRQPGAGHQLLLRDGPIDSALHCHHSETVPAMARVATRPGVTLEAVEPHVLRAHGGVRRQAGLWGDRLVIGSARVPVQAERGIGPRPDVLATRYSRGHGRGPPLCWRFCQLPYAEPTLSPAHDAAFSEWRGIHV